MINFNEEIQEEIKKLNYWSIRIGIAVILAVLIVPFLFTRPWGWLDFTETGNIGDTLGGITAPFIGLASAALIYISFRAQIRANQIQMRALMDDKKDRAKNESIKYVYELMGLMSKNYLISYSAELKGKIKSFCVKMKVTEHIPLLDVGQHPEVQNIIRSMAYVLNSMTIVDNMHLEQKIFDDNLVVSVLKFPRLSEVRNLFQNYLDVIPKLEKYYSGNDEKLESIQHDKDILIPLLNVIVKFESVYITTKQSPIQ